MDTKGFKALSSKEGNCDPPRKKKSLLQNRPWISTLLPYCFFSLHDTAYSEVQKEKKKKRSFLRIPVLFSKLMLSGVFLVSNDAQ
jgi:hypothetical protein